MIRLGLRLAFIGGRHAVLRLSLIVVAVGIGVAMLLTTLAGLNAVSAQNARYAWLETSQGDGPTTPQSTDPFWWRITGDTFHATTIGRVDIGRTGTAPAPPGMPRLPLPGEIFASPAMIGLMHNTPSDALRDRYPGRIVGTIGKAGLPAPNSLIIVVGRTPTQMRAYDNAFLVRGLSTTSPEQCNDCPPNIGLNANAMDLILAVVTAALLFPALVFIGSATRLSAARREQRFAAMRLVGATPRQMTATASIESGVGAVGGVVVGFALFAVFRPHVAGISFTGAPFFTSDLSVNLIDVLVVALGIPIAAMIAARVALRRVAISPLGVTRRETPKPPSAWRLSVVVFGIAELLYFLIAGSPESSAGQVAAYLSGLLIVMAGLVVAGPWLTAVATRVIAGRTNSPAILIAGRRLAEDPRAGFRAVSGLVLALFVGTAAIAIITTVGHDRGGSGRTGGSGVLVKDFLDFSPAGRPLDSVPSVPAAVRDELRAVPGVTGVAQQHVLTANGFPDKTFVTCVDMTAVRDAIGACSPGAQTAAVPGYLDSIGDIAHQRWPDPGMSATDVAALPVTALIVDTDGSTTAVERARTIIDGSFPNGVGSATLTEQHASDHALTTAYQRLADVVILASLPIAGCSLAVSVMGGISERRRPFSQLRLSGVPIALLRRVITLESAVPMLLGAALAIGAGFASAQIFLAAQLGDHLTSPDASYVLVVVAGILLSLAILGSTLPFLGRFTGPEAARDN